MTKEITNAEDILDSRDVIARLEELRAPLAEIAALREELDELDEADDAARIFEINREIADWEKEADDNAEELAALERFAQDGADNVSDWEYGEALIRDSYFEDYAQGLAKDIGAINPDAAWPNNCIDWERAARELKYDYVDLDFDGVRYWARA